MLTLLIASIVLELCVGIIVIYIGNLHYYQSASADTAAAASACATACCCCCYPDATGGSPSCLDCLLCCCRAARLSGAKARRHGNYLSVHTGGSGGGSGAQGLLGPSASGGSSSVTGGIAGVAGRGGDVSAAHDIDIDDDWVTGAGRGGVMGRSRLQSEALVLERADTGIEAARVKVDLISRFLVRNDVTFSFHIVHVGNAKTA